MAAGHRARRLVQVTVLLVVSGTLALAPVPSARSGSNAADSDTFGNNAHSSNVDIPAVLEGDTWLRHHAEDLMPYWDMPEALGEPVGNFPSFRGRSGEILPADDTNTKRGLSTLARGVYGYSLAFMLTGEERYLGYARAGLDWINTKAKDPEHGGFYGELEADGDPVSAEADKEVFDLASLGLAYGMYFNVTRDPAVEADLLAVRDLLFDKYYDPATDRVRDAMTYDLSTEVDTGGNGGDITNLLVPGTAIFLPNADLLTDAARRTQFRDDLRTLTQNLIDRHKDTGTTNPWWFWGRTARIRNLNALQTDFGHNIKSYEMIHNANQMFADRPWDGLADDRTKLLVRAWDDLATRWNHRQRNFGAGIERDSAWWIHNEADQTLAALDLVDGFTHTSQLARSAQSWLDVYVDRDPAYPARETFVRIDRTGAMTDLRKSHFGKNMLHAHEHALVMYLHGRALEGQPAKLHYAFPEDQALTAVAKPYWFDSTGQFRTVTRDLVSLPGHVVTEVEFTGLDAVPDEPFPPPADDTAPTTVATPSPSANANGWHREDVMVTLSATDDLVGVKAIHVVVEDRSRRTAAVAWIDPGESFTLPPFTTEGEYDVTYHAVDAVGNAAAPETMTVRIDRTAPMVSGMPPSPCVLWPPNHKMVQVAAVVGADERSGVAGVGVTATSDEPGSDDDIRIVGGRVQLRAERDPHGNGRVYGVTATVTDRAGNATAAEAVCVVPHGRKPEALSESGRG